MSDILEEVKSRIGATGTYNDPAISGIIEDVKAFILDVGVPESVVESDQAVGLIARGVADMWNYGAGKGEWSEIFMMRLYQLQLQITGGEDPAAHDMIPIENLSRRIGL